MFLGKVLGFLIGFFTLGPVGALIGLLVGHFFDKGLAGVQLGFDPQKKAEVERAFFTAVFPLMGHLAKSDGRVSEQEIAAARGVMAALRLDSMQVAAAINEFSQGKQPTFDLKEELATLRNACEGRPDLIRIFLEIQVRAALAGNNMEGPVRKHLDRVASLLGSSQFELRQIEAVLRIQRGNFSRERPTSNAPQQLVLAYQVLEVEATATNDEVVKAYRRALSRHHPDKLKANGLPESMIEHAKERTQQIIEAYELIKERRGIA